jgi:2-phospho-L-lactate/phosphoenolpyruvate guanylyltransferase
VQVAVLVPVKRFTAAKGRLRGTLEAADRARFAKWMATGVLEAVRGHATFVACDDDEVAEWAETQGAHIIWGRGLGLNGAVDDGIEQIAKLDFAHVTVAHADLPRPGNLASVAREHCVTLVPDRRRDGTNVMSFPTASPLRASYGGGSFGRHLAQALAYAKSSAEFGAEFGAGSGPSLEVRSDVDLSLDLDTPDDLTHPLIREVLPAWLRMNLDNRPQP